MGYRNLLTAGGRKLYTPNLQAHEGLVSLHLNENPYPPPAFDLASILAGVDLGRYERGGSGPLSARLAQVHGVSKGHILIDHGSSEVLRNLFLGLAAPGDWVLLPSHGWGFYQRIADLQGLRVVTYDLEADDEARVYRFDLPALKRLVADTAPAVVLIASPNAFTGNLMAQADLVGVLGACKGNTTVVVDQAYAEFSSRDDIILSALIETNRNLVFTRTLSKFYALANLRIGYAVTNPALAAHLGPYFPVFGPSGLGQALACQALDHPDHYARIWDRIDSVRRRFTDRVNALGRFVAYGSEANFVLVKTMGLDVGDLVAQAAQAGLVISNGSHYGLSQHMRITIGDEESMDRLYRVLAQAAHQG